MSRFPDDDTRESNLLTDDPFLSLADSNQQALPSAKTEYSRSRRRPSLETLKSRLQLDSSSSARISRQRFSDTTPSESTDNTWATATSQQNANADINNLLSTDDDTITVNRLSQHSPTDLYMDETPTQESGNEPVVRDYIPHQKMESPISPPGGGVSSTNMWDELEGIKRRLRQLELTHSSANGGTERPQTRGTTNSSSSPQRSSPFPSHAGTSITSTSSPPSYPLLNAAIAKVKASGLSVDVSQAIEATAQEAISLALMTNQDPSAQPPTSRAIRRKVDGVCRGLTEVCLALADQQQLFQRHQTRAALHRAEDAQDSSPLSATGRQSLTLSRTTARRVSGGTNPTRVGSTISRARRPAHSVVGITGEEFDDDGVSVVSRPGVSRFSTVQYRPPSRATTEVYRETTPPVSTSIQRFSTNRRSLLSRHAPSLSDYHIPTTNDLGSPSSEEPPLPDRTAVRTTFQSSPDDRRRSLNLATYFNSPPRTRTEFSRESGLPAPAARPVSLISPPRVNVARSTNNSAELRDSTIRRRPAASVVGEKQYATDVDDDIRSTTLGRSNSNRRSVIVGGDIRRHGGNTQTRYGSGMEDQ